MSQENFEKRIGDEYLEPLTDCERLSILCNLWLLLPVCAQICIVKVTACLMGLDLPTADSDLAVVLAGWPTLPVTDKRVLTYVVRTEDDNGR